MFTEKDKKKEEKREDKKEEKREEKREDALASKSLEERKKLLESTIKEDHAKKVETSLPVKAAIVNKTGTTYNLTIDGIPYQIKPGKNEFRSLETAKAIVHDLNISCPGEDNNPFVLEK